MTTSNNSFNFTDRASYIAWRSDWREEYAALSLKIRALKITTKEAQKAGSAKAPALQYELYRDSSNATALLKKRELAKKQSAAQRAARLSQPSEQAA